MNNEEKILEILSQMQGEIKTVNQRLGNLEQGQNNLEKEIKKVRDSIDLLQAQTIQGFRETKQDLQEVKENNQALIEMYGAHEVAIRVLRKKPDLSL